MGIVAINAEEIFVFADYSHWEHRSPRWKKDHNTEGFTMICIDKEGNVCNLEKDFARAEKMGRFPITTYKVIKSRYV